MESKKRSEVLPSIPFVWCWSVGRAAKCQLDSADGLAKTGASHTMWVPNAQHLLHKVQKSHQQKKDPKVFLVLVVGLEPTRSPTRPLNVRVCHSATPASMDYVSIIFFCCQEILKKKFTFSFLKKTN